MDKQSENLRMDVQEQKTAEMPDVNELLKILIEANQEQAAQSVAFLMEFDSMEEQLEGVNKELQAVRTELNGLQNTPQSATVKERLSGMIKWLEEKVHTLQAQIKNMKVTLNEKAGEVVANFKSHGVSTLSNVTKVLGIKGMLESLNTTMEKEFSLMEKGIERVNASEHKFREAMQHVKNAGRVLQGKEALETQYPEKGLFAAMRKPYQSLKNLYALGATETKHALAKVERLQNAAKPVKKEKESIADKLKRFKEQKAAEEVKQTVTQKAKGQEYGR